MVQMLAIPCHPPPRQLARLARILLFEWAFDPPIVRQVQQPPLAVVEIAARVCHFPSRISLRSCLGRAPEFRSRGQNPLFDLRVAQTVLDAGRIIFGEPPAFVEREALSWRDGLSAGGQGAGEHRAVDGQENRQLAGTML